MTTFRNLILKAIDSIAAAQDEMKDALAVHGKIIESPGCEIAELEAKVMALRNNAITAEIAYGRPTKEVAAKYGLTPARISQIAPRQSRQN